jgi:hypothetical protein
MMDWGTRLLDDVMNTPDAVGTNEYRTVWNHVCTVIASLRHDGADDNTLKQGVISSLTRLREDAEAFLAEAKATI